MEGTKKRQKLITIIAEEWKEHWYIVSPMKKSTVNNNQHVGWLEAQHWKFLFVCHWMDWSDHSRCVFNCRVHTKQVNKIPSIFICWILPLSPPRPGPIDDPSTHTHNNRNNPIFSSFNGLKLKSKSVVVPHWPHDNNHHLEWIIIEIYLNDLHNYKRTDNRASEYRAADARTYTHK